jgi:hypothetical protein
MCDGVSTDFTCKIINTFTKNWDEEKGIGPLHCQQV